MVHGPWSMVSLSLARDTAAFLLGGVCLTVSPLLVHGSADQSSKLKTMIQDGTGIKVVHLDKIAAASVPDMKLLQELKTFPRVGERPCYCFYQY
jgi:hypothetical protein